MTNPFMYHFNSPPQPPVPTVTVTKSSNNFPVSLCFLIIGLVLLLSIALVSSCNLDTHYIEDDYLTRKIQNNSIKIRLEDTKERNYKQFKAPHNGTLKLSKGTVEQVHHAIKDDSIILLTRKNIEGKAGQYLVVDIDANKKFTVKSVDEMNSVEEEDFGEVFFQIL